MQGIEVLKRFVDEYDAENPESEILCLSIAGMVNMSQDMITKFKEKHQVENDEKLTIMTCSIIVQFVADTLSKSINECLNGDFSDE